jgi:hypothetical protein
VELVNFHAWAKILQSNLFQEIMNLQDQLERRRRRNPNKIKPALIVMESIIDRLKEQSTWRGIILLVTSFGLTIHPEYQEHIIAVGIGLVGIINVFRKEHKIPKAEVVE